MPQTPDSPPSPPPERPPGLTGEAFLIVALVFEGGLGVVAILVGWLLGFPLGEHLHLSLTDAGWGIAAAGPMLLLAGACIKWPIGPLAEITEVLDRIAAPLFRRRGIHHLAAVSLLAGLGEELLFRGLIQGGVALWIGGESGLWIGLAVGSILFGVTHAITPTYAVLAGLIGLYLGGLWLWTGNLLAPIVTHALYDFVLLVYLARFRAPDRKAAG